MNNDNNQNSGSNEDLSFNSTNSQELDLTNPDIMKSIQNSQSIEIDIVSKNTKVEPVNNPYLNPSTPKANDPIAASMENAETTNEFDLLALNPSSRAKLKAMDGVNTVQKPAKTVKSKQVPSPSTTPHKNDPIAQIMSQVETTNEFDLLALNHTTRAKMKNEEGPEQSKDFTKTQTNSSSANEKPEIHINKTAIILISVFTFILLSAIALPYFSYKSKINASLKAKKEVEKVETELQAAVEKGSSSEDIDKLYASLISKQKALDSLASKVNKKDVKIYEDTVAVFVHEIMQELHAENYHIPKMLLDRVSFYIEKFTSKKTRGGMDLIMKRRDTYFPYIEKVFTEKKVPLVLAYVSMQESLLNPNAKSHAGAAGLWQFIPSTGRTYGLTINRSVDERLQWKKATVSCRLVISESYYHFMEKVKVYFLQ